MVFVIIHGQKKLQISTEHEKSIIKSKSSINLLHLILNNIVFSTSRVICWKFLTKLFRFQIIFLTVLDTSFLTWTPILFTVPLS